eukprot:TRINITY_DN3134_c0_g1_i7.p1 TRINITY_DN3134_c0_g1~~TRINITY_DN3134_c0_g1_i7.p1  ORF type:complete len:150 (-),score=10.62 TRINITY_DN3134_c0_g1_i7:499-948(-)
MQRTIIERFRKLNPPLNPRPPGVSALTFTRLAPMKSYPASTNRFMPPLSIKESVWKINTCSSGTRSHKANTGGTRRHTHRGDECMVLSPTDHMQVPSRPQRVHHIPDYRFQQVMFAGSINTAARVMPTALWWAGSERSALLILRRPDSK